MRQSHCFEEIGHFFLRNQSKAFSVEGNEKKKRKLAEAKLEATDPNFALSYDYKPVLFAGMVSPHEMVVVESPWLKVVQKLRDPMHRDRFGT